VQRTVHEAELSRVEPRAPGVVEYVLSTSEPVAYRPGQFISLRVGVDDEGHPILRSYSLAGMPGTTELSLVVRLIDGGVASSWFRSLAVGQRLEFTGPMGFFCLDLQHAGDVVFGATGVGIAPVLPMLTEALARPERGRVRLFWGSRHEEDVFWQRELAALAAVHARFSHQIYVSRATGGWTGLRGRITGPLVDALPGLAHPTFYLVGSGAMIRDVKRELVARGVDRKRQIRNEVFFD
jgi:ferredoxin-NADP reductase